MITTYTECWYCHEMYAETEKYCPVCRHKPKDESGRHVQVAQPIKIPIIYTIPRRIVVAIKRGEEGTELLQLNCAGESSTHFHGQRDSAPETGAKIDEWFAKRSVRVRTVPSK